MPQPVKNKWRAVAVQTHDAAVKYYRYHTYIIILGPTRDSGTEDKSFAEKSRN